ncbi:hypothetical protein D9M68_914390 [compost metagenome]
MRVYCSVRSEPASSYSPGQNWHEVQTECPAGGNVAAHSTYPGEDRGLQKDFPHRTTATDQWAVRLWPERSRSGSGWVPSNILLWPAAIAYNIPGYGYFH